MKRILLTILVAILFADKSDAQTISIVSSAGDMICYHTTDTFTATVVGSSTYGYSWKLNGTTVGTSMPTYTSRTLRTGVDTIFCLLTNAAGDTVLAASDTILVTVDTLPVVAHITGLDSVCVGDSMLESDITPGGVWSTNNSLSATVTANGEVYGLAPVVVAPGGPARRLNVVYMMTNGCGTDSVTRRINVNVPAGPITGPVSICSDTVALFTDTANGGIWTTSDTFTAEFEAIPLPIPGAVLQTLTTGTVTVYLNAANACGTFSDSMVVTVINCDTTTPSNVMQVTSLDKAVNIFPNPNNGAFSVSLTGKYTTANCVIANMLGENVKEVTLSNGSATQFNLNVPQGMYFVTVTSGGEKYTTKVIVAQ